LLEELSSYVVSRPPFKVQTVLIGQGFTAVRLADGGVGLALTPLTRFDTCVGATRLSGSLTRYTTRELAQFLNSRHPAHLKSVGLAAVNAVLQKEVQGRTDFAEGDFLEFLGIEPHENVAMIDYYTTKIESLGGSHLTIFDDRFAGKRKDLTIVPLGALPRHLPQADVVIVPPTFMEHIEDYRKLASKARHFVVVHPTTPPLPEPFFRIGVTIVASMMILDPEQLLKHVMEGAGTTLFKRFCKKIAFMKTG
jgi:uncharacterized protein (DUF4213/DUF364 family)